eukprot:bmy_14205T0
MALWAMPLREYWERKSSTLACRWGCSDYEDIEERPRPQSAASAPTTAVNPIAGEGEPYFAKRSCLHRVLAGSAVVMTMASRVASLTGSMVNLVFILNLSKVYVALARVLTKWETHRTQTKFEDAFTLKVFIFQFVNFYSSPIYIAFFKGRYRAFRGDDGRHARTHWNLLAIRLAFIIVCEHVAFSIGRVLDLLVPDIPGSVEIKVKREYYLAKQALAENEVLFGTNGAEEDKPLGSEMNLGPQA